MTTRLTDAHISLLPKPHSCCTARWIHPPSEPWPCRLLLTCCLSPSPPPPCHPALLCSARWQMADTEQTRSRCHLVALAPRPVAHLCDYCAFMQQDWPERTTNTLNTRISDEAEERGPKVKMQSHSVCLGDGQHSTIKQYARYGLGGIPQNIALALYCCCILQSVDAHFHPSQRSKALMTCVVALRA